MTREAFDKLVARVEAGLGRNPKALRRRVLWLVLVGYAGLLVGLLLILLVAAGFFATMFWADLEGKIVCGLAGAIVLLFGGYAALRALLVRVPPPEGRAVPPGEAPALHALLDELRAKSNSAPFHRVLLDADLNACVVQVPRLGLLGWPRNYLIIGLPLMDCLSPEELRAVLAHEFAHLSREHGRVSHWLYRLRRSWDEAFKQLSRPHSHGRVSLRPLTVRFVDWFWPRFNAHAFVLSRANEYEADAQAAALAGAPQNGSALARLALESRRAGERFWPALWLEANDKPEPPPDVFLRLGSFLRTGCAEADCAKWREEALLVKTTNADTHPCLAERLGALRLAPDAQFPAGPPPTSATEALLGPAAEAVRADVQKQWEKVAAEQWKHRHGRAAALSHRLHSLEQAVPDPAADPDSLWDKARVFLDLHGDVRAEPLLRQLLALKPDHIAANFHLGRLLLEERKPEGEDLLERAMEADDDLVPQACGLLHDYHRRSGRLDKLKEVAARMDRHEQNLAAARAESREVTARDRLAAHGLDASELDALKAVLLADREVALAWLGRKQLQHLPKQKMFLLCVQRRSAWHRLPSHDRDQALVARLSQAVRLPGRVLVFCPAGSFRPVANNLRRLPGAEILRTG
jgi:Zn-dependent protease with chaperone function